MKTLIVFNMSHRFDWNDGLVNRNYHVLRTLQQQKVCDRILMIDFLPFTAKKKLKVMLKARPWMRNAETVFWKWHTRVDRDAADPNLFWMSSWDTRSLSEVLKQLDFPEAGRVVWSYNPLAAKEVSALPAALSVFDAVDNWIEHSSYAAYRETLESCYMDIKKNADIIFTVSEGLVDFFEKRENVFYIPNGVDSEHFERAACNLQLLGKSSPERLRTRKAIVGYHGIIQPRVNLQIFDYLADKHPEFDFVIVGPTWKEMRAEANALRKKANVHFIGAVSYQRLPEILNCFDVAIIPHKIDSFTHSMNPLKMYEYLAAGKPIISTPVAGSDQFQDLVQLAVSPEDFSLHIQGAIAADSPELIARRRSMAEQHRWQQRVGLMLEIIQRMEKTQKTPSV
jgi:glycosyltransferase involved in cell wall biosynthesis